MAPAAASRRPSNDRLCNESQKRSAAESRLTSGALRVSSEGQVSLQNFAGWPTKHFVSKRGQSVYFGLRFYRHYKTKVNYIFQKWLLITSARCTMATLPLSARPSLCNVKTPYRPIIHVRLLRKKLTAQIISMVFAPQNVWTLSLSIPTSNVVLVLSLFVISTWGISCNCTCSQHKLFLIHFAVVGLAVTYCSIARSPCIEMWGVSSHWTPICPQLF